jgi:hypothetical protein
MPSATPADAIALLKGPSQVKDLFEQFEKAKGNARKQKLAQEISTGLTVHATIEEEILSPSTPDDETIGEFCDGVAARFPRALQYGPFAGSPI